MYVIYTMCHIPQSTPFLFSVRVIIHWIIVILSNRKNTQPGNQFNGCELCFQFALKYAQPILGFSKMEHFLKT